MPPGTTTATVLARAILNEGCKSVAAGMNPMDLRRGINLAVDNVLQVRQQQLLQFCSQRTAGGGVGVGGGGRHTAWGTASQDTAAGWQAGGAI